MPKAQTRKVSPLQRTGLNRPASANRSEQAASSLAQDPGESLTTNQGLLVSDNHNSLSGGERGPSLLEDHILREKIMHFDHERIPERVVHARGAGAHGIFEVYKSMRKVTKAGFLQDPAVTTPVFVRFSTVAGSRGSADTARDMRGFSVRFFTTEGEKLPRTDKPKTDAALSMAVTRKDAIFGRTVAMLIADEVDVAILPALRKALLASGVTLKLIAPRLGTFKTRTGKNIQADHSLPTVGSVLFDAVFIPGGPRCAEALCADANAVLFVKEAYKHGKAIAASDAGSMLIAKAAHSAGLTKGVFPGPGVIAVTGKKSKNTLVATFIAAIAMHRFPERPNLNAIVA